MSNPWGVILICKPKLLYCFSNELTGLKLSGLSQLSLIYAYFNNFEYIELEGCSVINMMFVYNNDLKKLDISSCSGDYLKNFDCEDNYCLEEIKVWPSFDIENPPSGYLKPSSAKYVYEFSE